MKLALRIKSPFLMILGALGLLSILGLLLLRHTFSIKTQITHELESHLKEVHELLSTSKVALTQAHVSKFTTQRDETKKKYEDLLLLLDTASLPQQDLTPLEFKEELLKTEQLLIERANLWNITIPAAIGFREFEGGNIPPATEVPDLALQLDALRTLINLLIESRVQDVSEIEKKKPRDIIVTSNRVMYQALPFEFALKGTLESLQTFLSKIYSSSHLLIVRKIDMESGKDDLLSVNLQIDAIKLKRKFD